MTATHNTRTQRAYRGVVYGIDVLDHTTGQIVRNDYVGQTRQRGRAREMQHRDTQPWSDLIVGSPRVLWEGVCTDEQLDEMERRFIQDVEVRPRLNWKLNEDNPQHIPKWILIEQRHQRDDAEGRPRWVPAEERPRQSLVEWDAAPAVPGRPAMRARRRWRSWQKHLLGLAVAWLFATVGGWAAIAYRADLNLERTIAVPAAAAVLTVWVWLGCPLHRRRQWRTAWRRVKRRIR